MIHVETNKSFTMLLLCYGIHFLLFSRFAVAEPQDVFVQRYLDLVNVYFKYRHVSVLTHFTCFSQTKNAFISAKLSNESFQSRQIVNFKGISQLIDTPQNTVQGFIVNIACDNFLDIFTQVDSKVIFNNFNFWLFVDFVGDDEVELSQTNRQWLSTLDMLPISEVIFAKSFNYGKDEVIDWILFDVHKISPYYPLQVSVYGYVLKENNKISKTESIYQAEEAKRIRITDKFLSKSTRSNLMGLKLKCGLVMAWPERFTYLEDPRVENVDIFMKSTSTVVNIMKENLNMSCDIWQVDSFGWNSNGTFNGVMGLFQRKKVQILSHGTIMRVDRLAHVEFTAEIFVIETPIIFRQPPLSTIANIFLLPLDSTVWCCCFAIMLVAMAVMYSQFMHASLRRSMSAYDIISFVVGAVCQQGTHLVITTTSGRFVMLTIFLSALAIFTSYSASIVALLQSPSHLIETIDDLVKSPLKMALQDTQYNHQYYAVENITVLNKVYEKKIKPMDKDGWIYDPFIGVEKIRTQLFAFQVESASAYKAVAKTYTESEKCSLSEINLLQLGQTTVTIERNSPYKELVKRSLRYLRENGLMQRLKRRWFPKKPICEGGVRDFMTVGLQEVKPALYLLIIGTSISLLLVIVEIFIHKMFTQNGMNRGQHRPHYVGIT